MARRQPHPFHFVFVEDDPEDELEEDAGAPPLATTARSRRVTKVAGQVRALLAGLPENIRRQAVAGHAVRQLYPRIVAGGGQVESDAWERSGLVRSALVVEPKARLVARCTCRAAPDCLHVGTLLAWIAQALTAGEGRFAAFVDLVEPPTFEERLATLDPLLAPAEKSTAAERVRLRIVVTGAGAELAPVMQKSLKRGGFSVPRAVGSSRLESWRPGTPAEQLLLSTLADLSSDPIPVVTTLLALRAAPGMVIDEHGQARRVVATELGIGVVRTDEGYRAVPMFGGIPCADGVAFTTAGAVALPPAEDHVYVAQAPPDLLRLAGHLVREPLVAPEELAPLLVERFSRLEPAVTLTLPPELAGREVERDDRVVFVMEPVVTGATVRPRLRPLPGGPLVRPGEGPTELSRLVDGERRRVTRALDDEPARVEHVLRELGFDADEEGIVDLANEDVLDLLERLRQPPLDAQVALEWPKDHRPPSVVKAGALRVRVTALADWFGVEGGLEVSGQVLELASLLDAVREGRRFVAAGPHQFVNIERLFRGRLTQLADVARPSRRGLELSRHAAAVAPDLFDGDDAPGEEVVTPLDWRELADRARRARALEPRLPAGLHAELREYQVDGYKWLRRLAELGTGAVLADDMGLGKTVQAIAMLLERAAQGPQLVVAPTSVGFNWAREIARFAPGLRVVPYREGDRRATVDRAAAGDVLIASYGLVRADGSPLSSRRWTTLVLDEAHAVKSWQSATAKAVRGLEADWRVALTGTPVENHLGELWSLLQTVVPGLLGGWEEFSRIFATPIEKGRSEPRRRALSRVLRPFVLRRTKGEVLRELPPRTEVRLDAVLSRTERALYESARLAAIERLAAGGGEDGRFEMLAALTKLRQLASHARMIVPEAPPVSAKLAVLLEALEEAREEGHRCLVFSQFVRHLELIRGALEARGFAPLQLDGSTPAAERARLVDRFQKGDVPVLLVSLKAGGTGLNLTAADTVFLMDPWWNPAVEDQAADRAHRMGQTRPVTVVRIVAKGTVEEKVLAMHDRKRALVTGILDGADSAGKLSTGELLELLEETPAAFDEEPDDAAPETLAAPEPVAKPVVKPRVKPAKRDVVAAPAPEVPAEHERDSWAVHVDGFSRSLSNLAPGSAQTYVGAVRRVLAGATGADRVRELEAAVTLVPDSTVASAVARFLRYLYAAKAIDRAAADGLEEKLAGRRATFRRA